MQKENRSYKWNIPWYTMREHWRTILYHAIEKTVANTIYVTYVNVNH